ncbi:carboxypeptidase-like regulatory domain-containing protein [Bremerella sp. JC817]|uniref:carboxypeptidase-like regulatory domain-containing protein n=1 Tax=Bremerella sp. JC817 TaxID=3231756 RepID=UPI00345834AB
MKFAQVSVLLCASVALLLIGCGKAPSQTFTGKITLDGNPLAQAGIELLPKEGGATGVHYGTTDAEGRFTITEDDTNPITPGEYSVVVDKVPTEMGGKSEVPDPYRNKEKTPLSVTIADGSTDLAEIELSSKP